MPMAVIIGTPITQHGCRLTSLSHLILTGCQSGMSADRATMGFSLHGGLWDKIPGARIHSPGWTIPSWQQDNSGAAILSLGAEDSSKLLLNAGRAGINWQRRGASRLPRALEAATLLSGTLHKTSGIGAPPGLASDPTAHSPLLSLIHKILTQTQNG